MYKIDYKVVWLVLFIASLVACSNAPVKPRESIAIANSAIESAADLVAIAKRDGHIDAAERDELISKLVYARVLADAAQQAVNNGDSEETKLGEIRVILSTVKAALPKE